MKQLLVEKYRPKNVENYVFNAESTARKVEKWLEDGEIPNILLSGGAGTGKSTLAGVLVNELGIQQSDVYRVNASLQNGIGFVREELEPWCKKSSFSKFKVVIMEEADSLGLSAQKSLRDITESYSDRVRWIFTCNYPEKIIPALLSRFQHIHIDSHDEDNIINLVLDIVEAEGLIVNDERDLLAHIDQYQPDIRKIINSIDEYTDSNKVLHAPDAAHVGTDIGRWEELWKAGEVQDKFSETLELSEHIDQNNYDWFYEVMYTNHHNFIDQHKAIILLSKYLDRAQRCANQRLHLKAFLYHAFCVDEE